MVKIPASRKPEPEALRALALLQALRTGSQETDVLEAFEELDALPGDVVRDVLETWTGPAPDPSSLDAAVRKAHGFPPPALQLVCVRSAKPASVARLDGVTREQIRIAGRAWDGQDLEPEARLAQGGGEASFAGSIEIRSFVDASSGAPRFDVVLHGESGEIFRPGSTTSIGQVADGIIELKDRVAREALQRSLRAPVDVAPVVMEEAPISAMPETEDAPSVAPETLEAPAVPQSVDEAEVLDAKPTKKKAAARKKTTATVKKAAAKKTAAAPKKTTAKKATAKKASAKKTTAKKATAKKASAKKTATAKKTTAKKTSTKATAKKASAAKKMPAKKTSAKKATAKKASSAKKATAKKRASA